VKSLLHSITLRSAAFLLVPVLCAEPEGGMKGIVRQHFNSIAIIEGDGGAGTGFIVKEGETTRLYTAAHVIAGNKRLTVKNADGRQFLKFGVFEVASASDLARIELLQDFDSGLRIAKPGSMKADDPLLAIGNSGGAGALTLLEGRVVSLGPDVVEVSNGVIQGNSGGPVFSAASGEVVAVVTHLIAGREDLWAKETGFSGVRRFATRLDRDVTWQKVPIGKFLAEAVTLAEYNRNTRILLALSMLDPTQDGLRLDVQVSQGGPTLLTVFNENKNVPTVAALIEMNSKLGDKRLRTSESDLRRRFSSFYDSAVTNLNRDGAKFLPDGFSGYHRKQAAQEKEWRAEALKEIQSAAARLR